MSNEAAGLLKHFLEQRQVAGQTHVVLKPGMLDRLKQRGKPARPTQTPIPTVSLPTQSRTVTTQPTAQPSPKPAATPTLKSPVATAPTAGDYKPALIQVTGQT